MGCFLLHVCLLVIVVGCFAMLALGFVHGSVFVGMLSLLAACLLVSGGRVEDTQRSLFLGLLVGLFVCLFIA